MDVMDNIHTWIYRHGDALFQDELCKLRHDFPEEMLTDKFIYDEKFKYLKLLKDKAELKIKINHTKWVSKNRKFLRVAIAPNSNNKIND